MTTMGTPMLMRSGASIVWHVTKLAYIIMAVQGANVTIFVNLLAPHLHAKHAVLQHSNCDVRSNC